MISILHRISHLLNKWENQQVNSYKTNKKRNKQNSPKMFNHKKIDVKPSTYI